MELDKFNQRIEEARAADQQSIRRAKGLLDKALDEMVDFREIHEFHTLFGRCWHVTLECHTPANSQRIDERAACSVCHVSTDVTPFKNQNAGTTFDEDCRQLFRWHGGRVGYTCTRSTVESRDVSISRSRFCSCVDCTPCTHVNLEHLSICILITVCWPQFPFLSSGKVTNADDQLRVTKDFACLGVAWKETSFASTWFGIAIKSTHMLIWGYSPY